MPSNPDKTWLRAVLAGEAAPGPVASCPAAARLGARLVALDPERLRIRIDFDLEDGMRNGSGVVFGGLVAAMLDMLTAFSVIAFTDIEHPGTIDLHAHFLRPASRGVLHGEGGIVRAGRRIVFAEAALRDEDGREVARASSALTG